MHKELYARPTHQGKSLSNKFLSLLKTYGPSYDGACLTENSSLYLFLKGAEAAAVLIENSGRAEDKLFARELNDIVQLVRDTRAVTLELK